MIEKLFASVGGRFQGQKKTLILGFFPGACEYEYEYKYEYKYE